MLLSLTMEDMMGDLGLSKLQGKNAQATLKFV
jgi:hypothetical protein